MEIIQDCAQWGASVLAVFNLPQSDETVITTVIYVAVLLYAICMEHLSSAFRT